MRVLVTGGAGYLGATVSDVLLARGHSVRALDNLLYGGEALLGLLPRAEYEFVKGDVREGQDRAKVLQGADAIVHLAAVVGDPACARDPEEARATNVTASEMLFDEAATCGVGRFVFASTCSNYGRMAASVGYVDESSTLAPVSLYAETKVAVERRLLTQSPGSGPAATCLRFATLFGLAPRMRFDLTVNQFSAELALGNVLAVYGEQFWRPYVHVRDAAEAIGDVLDASLETVASEAFNVGATEENFTKQMLIDIIGQQMQHEPQIQYVHVVEDPRDYRVSFSKIRDELGFRPTRSVNDGIAEVIGAVRDGIIDYGDERWRN